MIARIRGEVVGINDDHAVVDVNGVGYEVFCHGRELILQNVGQTVVLHVHTAVSDDAIRLYGFSDADELRLFRLLIGVDRIGPRAALAMLSRSDLATLGGAIADSNIALLATVPGIGRKTAERIALELHDKLTWLSVVPVNGAAAAAGGGGAAVAALVGMGFREPDARRAVAEVGTDESDLSRILAAALRRLDTVGGGA